MKSASYIFVLAIFLSCQHSVTPQKEETRAVAGDIIIFHAGSLSVPFQQTAKAFEREYPGTRVLPEAAGSMDCARKITELHKPCDIMASSDYQVIEKLLIPAYTSWHLPFVGNEMVLAYTEKSIQSDIISSQNWFDLLLRDDVHFGRSDPDTDPCGYRTLMVMKLAGKFYGRPELIDIMLAKDQKYIRPKEVDLLSLLELHETDYIFIYRSVAVQHGLKFLELPGEINLGNIEFDEQYGQISVMVKGNSPGSLIEVKGEAITYAIAILDNAPNPAAAKAFLEFLLESDKGMKILTGSGHKSLIPVRPGPGSNLPGYLEKYLITAQKSL